ncbi:MAG TPA: ATP synthase F0 subunit B [Acidimicrobiales bacterium]|nr:ATP synthase F0 subunit B [Acidimicrobiales bacterium]
MPVVVIHAGASGTEVVVPRQETTTTTASTKEAPNPILPVGNEVWWGLGCFLALVLLMRVWLFPRMKKGMMARNAKIQGDLDDAERVREEAADDVAAYDAALAEARGEAARILEVARHEVDADRSTKVTAANARISERRAAAQAELDAARAAALGQVEDIAVEVASAAAERILGQPVDRATARPIVSEVVRTEVPV